MKKDTKSVNEQVKAVTADGSKVRTPMRGKYNEYTYTPEERAQLGNTQQKMVLPGLQSTFVREKFWRQAREGLKQNTYTKCENFETP